MKMSNKNHPTIVKALFRVGPEVTLLLLLIVATISPTFATDSLPLRDTPPSYADSVNLYFDNQQIAKVLEKLDSNSMAPEWFGLIGAGLGGALAILSQFLLIRIQDSKERKNQLIELVSEERRLTQMVDASLRELAWLRTSAAFWMRYIQLETRQHDKNQTPTEARVQAEKQSFEQFISFRDRIPGCRMRINDVLSEYAKAIAKFSMMAPPKSESQEELKLIRDYKELEVQCREFNEANTYDELETASDKELVVLKERYLAMMTPLDENYQIMRKLIGKEIPSHRNEGHNDSPAHP